MATVRPIVNYSGNLEELRSGDTLVGGGGGGSSPLTTKGDVYTYSTADARLPVGTDGQVLTADSAQATGLKWSARAYAVGDVSFYPGMSTNLPWSKAAFDWFVSEGLGKWSVVSSFGARVFNAADYPDIQAGLAYANYGRIRPFRFGSTWGAFPNPLINQNPTFNQTTTDLATMTNRDVPAFVVGNAISASWIDEANSRYVATIWGGTSYIYSSDGITWTFVPYIFAASATAQPSALTKPVVVGSTYSFYDSARARRYYTTDHSTFTQVSTSVLVGGDHNGDVHLCNGLLFMFKNSSTTYYTSSDGGITWVARTWPSAAGAANTTPVIVWNGSVYLYTTQGAASNTSIYTSPDLTTWTNRTCAFTAAITINRLSVANGVFFAFSSVSQTKFCTSPDGITWTERTANTAALYGMAAYVNSKYMIFATTRTEGSAALATWAAETTSGPSALSRIGSDVFLVIDAANSKLVFCTSTFIWTAYSGGAWSTILTTAQLGTAVNHNFLSSGSVYNCVVRVKA